MARGADSSSEAGSDSSSDEIDPTAPAPANGEDAMPTREECVEAISTIATEFKCPIGHDLPIAPVMAKDGVVYERAAIERWFKTKEGDPTQEGWRFLVNISCWASAAPRTTRSDS